MRGHNVIVEMIQVVVQIILHQIQALVMFDDGHFCFSTEFLRKSIEQNLLVDGEFVKDDQYLRTARGLDIRGIEPLSMLGNDQVFFHQNTVCFFDGLF